MTVIYPLGFTFSVTKEAKQSDGFVDQKKFKTADNYSFDSFNLCKTR